jgi:hypothetical protein
MADKQHYVKINFEYGNDDGNGSLTPKNTGESLWVSLPYDQSVGLQNYAIIPALVLMMERAGELGMEISGATLPTKPGEPDK